MNVIIINVGLLFGCLISCVLCAVPELSLSWLLSWLVGPLGSSLADWLLMMAEREGFEIQSI